MATAIWEDVRPAPGGAGVILPPFATDDVGPFEGAFAKRLAGAAIDGDSAGIEAALAAALNQDGDLADLLTGPVAAAARRLGEFWVEDALDFVAVTMASWTLRQGVERLLDARPVPLPRSGRQALFASAPGDQHGFGSFLIGAVFARAGWVVALPDGDDLAARVAEDWIDLVGLTATADRHRATLAPTIAALRRASRNPQLTIIVGGRVFDADVALAGAIGADGTAPDARAALALADRLVAAPVVPC